MPTAAAIPAATASRSPVSSIWRGRPRARKSDQRFGRLAAGLVGEEQPALEGAAQADTGDRAFMGGRGRGGDTQAVEEIGAAERGGLALQRAGDAKAAGLARLLDRQGRGGRGTVGGAADRVAAGRAPGRPASARAGSRA